MVAIEENRFYWGEKYTWPEAGEEWSRHWGSARMQWYGSLLPRICAFVPTDTILEIAPNDRNPQYYLTIDIFKALQQAGCIF